MTLDKQPPVSANDPAPCPKCGKLPETRKTGSYWQTRCTTAHMFPVYGHTMRTKREAIQEWNNEHRPTQDTKKTDMK